EYFQVLHDRLILQHNKKAWELWHKDVEDNLKKADANWPTLSQQKAP
ncbi:MAG: YHS domain protein, partial [Verrucomicrobia bacterium]